MKTTSIIPERGGVEVTEEGNVRLLFFLPGGGEGYIIEMAAPTWEQFVAVGEEKLREFSAAQSGLTLPEKPKLIVPT